MSGDILICDTEAFPNFWSIGFKRVSDGKVRVFEHSWRKPITERELDLIRAFMAQNTVVGYNFLNYDAPMIAAVLDGRSPEQLKVINDQIIEGGLRYWQTDEVLGFRVPAWDMIDLMEPQPNPRASLKTLAGRMHAPLMQDLPYEPSHWLTDEEADKVLAYMGNDLDNTHLLFDMLDDPLEMRRTIGADFGVNFMSKSDAQMGEGMIKKRVEQKIGKKVYKTDTPAGTTFKYKPPAWMKFETPQMQALLERIRAADFMIQANGKVKGPDWLDEYKLTIGDTEYAMGLGGLHSTEKNRAVHEDDDDELYDFDVASYYPAIILNAGLYPKSLGPEFIEVYRAIRDERVAAKRRGAAIKDVDLPDLKTWPTDTDEQKRLAKARYKELEAELAVCKTKDKGLKIALNGCFGKLGSPYSVLYAPHLMIAITLGGQLALLMLIERAELAGVKVVSGNTDGVVFKCPRDLGGTIVKDRLDAGALADIVTEWEGETGFELEATQYRSLYNASVNSYYARMPNDKFKVKGKGWTGRYDGDVRSQLMKNPSAEVVALAVIEHIKHSTPLMETIKANRDIRDFVTVVNVAGGGTWRGEYLGKVVRYYWGHDGDEIFYKTADARTGNHKRVSKSDGARPLMNIPAPDFFPGDIDYERYEHEAQEVLMDIAFFDRPPPIKKVRIFKYNAIAWFALAV